MPGKKKVFIFDLDGTLADTRTDMIRCVNRVRHLYDLPDLPEELARTLVGHGMDFLYRACFPEIVAADEAIPAALQQKFEMSFTAGIVVETRAYDGILETMQALTLAGTVFVFTKKPEGITRHELAGLGLLDFVTEVVGGDSHPDSKPSAAPVREALQRQGLVDAELFMIGDSQLDMQAAKNLGATAVWCKWGYYREAPASPSPDVAARVPAELLPILLH